MTAPLGGPMQNEPNVTGYEIILMGICAVLCSVTQKTGNITKTTNDDRGGIENEEVSKRETCFLHGVNSVPDLVYSAGACVEQLHLFEQIAGIFMFEVNLMI
jgi:hypothetical protein